MNKLVNKVRLLVLALSMVLGSAYGLHYENKMSNTSWYLEADNFHCQLDQSIDGFGQVVFYASATENLQFWIQTQKSPAKMSFDEAESLGEQVQYYMTIPAWQKHLSLYEDTVLKSTLYSGDKPIKLPAEQSFVLLESLHKGFVPFFEYTNQYKAKTTIAINNVSFNKVVYGFYDCLTNLQRINPNKISFSQVHFDAGKIKLAEMEKQWLKRLVSFLQFEGKQYNIKLNGYSDSAGDARENYILSKKRVLAVKSDLIKMGVPSNRIQIKYHGERKQIKPKGKYSYAEKARLNRRVTVTVDRFE